jgi:membrane-bound lytic murein transglycosylase D
VRIEAILGSEGMPTDLVWVAAAESGFDPNDTSAVGAVGLWQLMPDTARSYGLRVDAWVDERRDPERSTRAAAHLLRDLYARFGAWDLALAAYNMGYGALLRTIRKYNTNDFERVASLEAGLPFETTTYVPRILAAAIGARNLEALGFTDVVAEPPIAWEDAAVMRSVPLDALAHALDVRTDVLRQLNPALLGARTPPGDDVHPFVLHVPLGLRARTVAWIDQVALPDMHTYAVRHGETLDEIAARFGVANGTALLALSGFAANARIEPGTLLLVPPPPGVDAQTLERPLVAVDAPATAPADRRRVFYHVVQGETVRDIASALAVLRDELLTWNALDANARLQGGLWLQAFVNGTPAEARIWEASEVTLVQRGSEEFYDRLAASNGRVRRRIAVHQGETMRSIADRYGLTVGSLARINHRSRNGALVPGEDIVVYAPPEQGSGSSAAPSADDNTHDDVPPPSCPVAPAGASNGEASEGESATTSSAPPG